MLTESENIIPVPGGKVWSQIVYDETVANKTPLIFLHGGPGSTYDKLKWGLHPLAKQLPLIFYDQLGGGNSTLPQHELENPDLWQVPRFVAELEAVIEFYNLQSFHLSGTSWGATLAMEYLLTSKNPKAKSVIFSSPMLSTLMWIEDANRLKQELPEDICAIMLKCELGGTTASAEYQKACEPFYAKHCLRKELLSKEQLRLHEKCENKFNTVAYANMWGPSEFFASGSLLGYDRYNDLAKVKIPSLFLCGEFDEATPETVNKFHKKTKHSQFHVFENCSHQAYFEDAVAYNKVVGSFIKSIEG